MTWTPEETNRWNELCYSVLNNPHGKELVKFLNMKFLHFPVADPNINANTAFYREGQNDLIRKLKAGIYNHSITMRGTNA